MLCDGLVVEREGGYDGAVMVRQVMGGSDDFEIPIVFLLVAR